MALDTNFLYQQPCLEVMGLEGVPHHQPVHK